MTMNTNTNTLQHPSSPIFEQNFGSSFPRNGMIFDHSLQFTVNEQKITPPALQSVQKESEAYMNENNCKILRPRRSRNPWGNLSYANLIALAIIQNPNKKMKLNEIYLWFIKNVTYFAARADDTKSKGWKNSIRHNLSLKREFQRESGEKKAGYWSINEKLLMERIRLENRQINDPQYNKDMELYESMIKKHFSINQNDDVNILQEPHISYLNNVINSQENFFMQANQLPIISFLNNNNENPFLFVNESQNRVFNGYNQELLQGPAKIPIHATNLLSQPTEFCESDKSNSNSENCLSSVSKGSKIFSTVEAPMSTMNSPLEINSNTMAIISTHYNTPNIASNSSYIQMGNNSFNGQTELAPMGLNGGQMYIGNSNVISNDETSYQSLLFNCQMGDQIQNYPSYLLGNECINNGNQFISVNGLDPQYQYIKVLRNPMNLQQQQQQMPANYIDMNALYKSNFGQNIQNINAQQNLQNNFDFNFNQHSQNMLLCNQTL